MLSTRGVTLPSCTSVGELQQARASDLPDELLDVTAPKNQPRRMACDDKRDVLAAVRNDESPGASARRSAPQRPATAVVEDRVVPFLAQIVVARVIDDTVGPELPRPSSTFSARQTAVTWPPYALAIWTAKLPTPPVAPVIAIR